ncbi:MAG: C39 family peptidase [Candidatus Thorarchaeota archaeon]
MKRNTIRVALVLTTVALLGVPLTTPHAPPSSRRDFSPSTSTYGHIDGVPYVWQEINGYCYWASVDMALQYAGLNLDLGGFFAASGIGFSSVYIMIDDLQMFMSGSSFRQQQQIPYIAELLGLDYIAYFDSNSEWIQIVAPYWSDWGFNFELIDGSVEALDKLRDLIDTGYPAVLWVDPYWLPAEDYVDLRSVFSPQDPAAPASGHAIVVTGYNDTSETVEIMDPGVGAFGENYGYPSDGRYFYTANYTTLDLAWKTLGYGTIAFMSGDTVENQEERIGAFIANRLLGNATSYASDLEDLFFAGFGESAFRGLSLDTTKDGIKNYLGEHNDTADWPYVLAITGLSHESYMSLQYPAYRSALEALPSLMPSYDVTEVVELGRAAYPHMVALSNNASLVDLYYTYNGSELTRTYFGIAERYQETEDIDVALDEFSEDIESLTEHFLGIADAWQAAGEALESVLEDADSVLFMLVGIGTLTMSIFAVLVVVRRRR